MQLCTAYSALGGFALTMEAQKILENVSALTQRIVIIREQPGASGCSKAAHDFFSSPFVVTQAISEPTHSQCIGWGLHFPWPQ
jgi:hypothetical protein